MNTSLQTYNYNGQSISFEMSKSNVMVNATEMAKIFGKQVNEFMSNETTKEFLNACLKNGNSRFINISSESDLIISTQKRGTWMHRVLALKFAAWLNPAFELWVYITIDNILFGSYRKLEESIRQTAQRRNRIEELRNSMRNIQDFLELERLELEDRQAAYQRSRENKNQLELFMEEEKSI